MIIKGIRTQQRLGHNDTGTDSDTYTGTDPLPDPCSCPDIVSGRSQSLVSARNRHMLCRFLYWNQKADARYESIVASLSREFYISERTVSNIIHANLARLQQLRRDSNPAIWRKEYDFFRW
jgi:hypothetical protein